MARAGSMGPAFSTSPTALDAPLPPAEAPPAPSRTASASTEEGRALERYSTVANDRHDSSRPPANEDEEDEELLLLLLPPPPLRCWLEDGGSCSGSRCKKRRPAR